MVSMIRLCLNPGLSCCVLERSGVTETFLIDPDLFGSELQKKFACSTAVRELPGKKGYEVLIQGGVIDDVARYMVEHYGVPKEIHRSS